MTEIARAQQTFAELELLLSEGKYEDAKILLVSRLEQNRFDRETRLYLLLVNVMIDGPVAYETDIDQLRSLSDLTDIEREIIRRLFILGFKSAEKEGRQDQTWAYQRLLRRLLLNQALDQPIPKSAARRVPTNPPGRSSSELTRKIWMSCGRLIARSKEMFLNYLSRCRGFLGPRSLVFVSRCRELVQTASAIFVDRSRRLLHATGLVFVSCYRQLLSLSLRFLSRCRRIPEMTWKPKVSLQRALIGATVGLLIIPLHYFLSVQRHPLKPLPGNTRVAPAPSVSTPGLTVTNVALSEKSDSSEMLKREKVQSMLTGQLSRLRRAYSEGIEKNPNLMGTLVLKMKIDADGNIVKVQDMASRLSDAEFLKVVLAEVHSWKFSKAQLGAGEFTLPLLFVPQDMDPRTIVRWEQTLNSSEADAKALFPVQITASSKGGEERTPSVTPNQKPAELKKPEAVLALATKPRKSEAPAPRHAIDYKTRRIAPLRQEPRFAAATTEHIGPGIAVSVIEAKGDWLKVRTRPAGSVGYVRKEYVTTASAAQ